MLGLVCIGGTDIGEHMLDYGQLVASGHLHDDHDRLAGERHARLRHAPSSPPAQDHILDEADEILGAFSSLVVMDATSFKEQDVYRFLPPVTQLVLLSAR